MNDRSPRFVSRLRTFVPLAVLVLILAGASAAFASGAFESNDSGFDSARDVAERGAVDASTTSTLPERNDANDDSRVASTPVPASTPAPSQDESTATVPDGTSTFGAGDAGSVTIRRTVGTLSVVSVNANPGWVAEVEQGTGVEIEVKFVNGTTRLDFSAELEDGEVRVRVRVDAPDASRVDNSGPGNASDNTASDDNSGPGTGDDRDSGHGGSNSGHGSSGHSGAD